jgi:hypothetical protein
MLSFIGVQDSIRETSSFPPLTTFGSPRLHVRSVLTTVLQVRPSRALATVSDSPLDKKVEMTNWEKVRQNASPALSSSGSLGRRGFNCPCARQQADIDLGQLHQLQVSIFRLISVLPNLGIMVFERLVDGIDRHDRSFNDIR